jgi:hypothetical protein
MDISRTKIIACATVIEEMLPLLPPGMAYEVLDFGLHLSPPNLRQMLQAAVDASCPNYETLLLGYGLCSMAVIGLKANGCRLVIPRTDDCIGIFLGSQQAYSEQVSKEAGTYYLTKGWIEVADTPFDEYERLVEQYGVERAKRIMDIMLKNYKRLVYIDTGHQDNARYVEIAKRTAEKFHLRFEEVRGSNALIVKMLKGEWDDDFLVVERGQTVSYLDFKLVQPKRKPDSTLTASLAASEEE